MIHIMCVILILFQTNKYFPFFNIYNKVQRTVALEAQQEEQERIQIDKTQTNQKTSSLIWRQQSEGTQPNTENLQINSSYLYL